MLCTTRSARALCSCTLRALKASTFMASSISARSSADRDLLEPVGGPLQIVQRVDREGGKVVDEVERVLDFVSDARGQRPEMGEPLLHHDLILSLVQLLQPLSQLPAGVANGVGIIGQHPREDRDHGHDVGGLQALAPVGGEAAAARRGSP